MIKLVCMFPLFCYSLLFYVFLVLFYFFFYSIDLFLPALSFSSKIIVYKMVEVGITSDD